MTIRTKVVMCVVVAVVLVAAAVSGVKLKAGSPDALDEDAVAGISMGSVHEQVGDRISFLVPTLANRSDEDLVVSSIEATDGLSSALTCEPAQIYRSAAFDGGVVLYWDPKLPAMDPRDMASTPVEGYAVSARTSTPDTQFMLIGCRIHEAGRWVIHGVTVTYTEGRDSRVHSIGPTVEIATEGRGLPADRRR